MLREKCFFCKIAKTTKTPKTMFFAKRLKQQNLKKTSFLCFNEMQNSTFFKGI